MLRHIPELIKAGVASFKIEGCMKSAYYTAVITNAYRMAMDAYEKDPVGYRFDEALWREVESVSHREYCTGYWFDDPRTNPQLCTEPGYIREKAYFAVAEAQPPLPEGLVAENGQGGLYLFKQRNKLSVGDRAELLTPGKVGRGFTVTELYDEAGAPVESAPHPLMRFYVRVPFAVSEGDILRAGDEEEGAETV